MEESAPKRQRTEGSASPRKRRPSYASPTKASMSRHHPEAFERRMSRSPQKLPSARQSAQFTFDSPSEALAARLATSRIVSDAPTPTRPGEATPVQEDFNPFRGGGLRRSPPAGVRMDIDTPPVDPFRRGGLRRSPPVGAQGNDAPPASMPEPELPPAVQASSPPALPASMPEPRIERPADESVLVSESDASPPLEESPPEEVSIARSISPVASPSPARSFSSLNIQLPPRSSSEVRSPSPALSSPAQAPEQQTMPEPEAQQELPSDPVSESDVTAEEAPESGRGSPSPPPPLPEFSPSPPPASMPPSRIPRLAQESSRNKAPAASQPVPQLPPLDNGPRKSFQNSPVRFRDPSQQDVSPLTQPPSRHFEKPRKGQVTTASQKRKPAATTVSGSRQTRPFDPDAEKKKERERIQKEIKSLQKDLEVARRENERIRAMQEFGRVLAPVDQDEIVDLIQRHLMDADTEPSQTSTQQLLQAALKPTALLPFGKAIAPAPSAPVDDKLAYVKSHYPVPMTADEELPYLQLFTPFTASSTISILPETDSQPLRQLHSVLLRSREIPGLFTAKVEMTVNPLELSVLNLKVTDLEPAAKPELGPFIQKICTGDCNRSMQRNVGIVTWAMGEWLRVAVERAGFWCQLEQTLGTKNGISEMTTQMRTRKRRRKDDDGDEDMDESAGVDSVKKVDLIRYMGQQHYDISIPYNDAEESGANVRFNWKVEFDWTGEAQTKLSVLVGAPGKWHQTDERGVLGKIPKLFEELVHGHQNTETAVKTIVALIAGEQS
ncbi:hypothetical protein FPOA_03910 [Fusarium poae]|uniref:Uncharacterized protein n=1 Tax=Fusarium poae TaxID=36050 RepID=A0A1B8ASL5_FUSPO|nr:hypothetical protein FPOA_03910 [Fusarium poae]